VESSVIFEYSRLGSGVRLKDKLVFGRYCVDRTGATLDLQATALDWWITDARHAKPPEAPIEGNQNLSEALEIEELLNVPSVIE
jgi:mannose-1-phosphate guanylyltransferase